ncbi:hypothetical protein [Candidatus Nitrosocosmicus sp. R]
MDEKFSTASVETNSLIEKGLIHSINATKDPNPMVVMDQRPNNEKFSLTSIGLIHIFNNKYIYSPEFLLKYHKDIFLQKVLFSHIQTDTIKVATAKFFNIITEHLTTASNYVINLSLEMDNPPNENTKNEIEHKIKIFSLILGLR